MGIESDLQCTSVQALRRKCKALKIKQNISKKEMIRRLVFALNADEVAVAVKSEPEPSCQKKVPVVAVRSEPEPSCQKKVPVPLLGSKVERLLAKQLAQSRSKCTAWIGTLRNVQDMMQEWVGLSRDIAAQRDKAMEQRDFWMSRAQLGSKTNVAVMLRDAAAWKRQVSDLVKEILEIQQSKVAAEKKTPR